MAGVIGLFSTVCQELGFIIECIRPAYPDCLAVRRTPQGEWRPVSIEFEYCSLNFRTQGHDPDCCDLIVCWDHNWDECPVDVLELKTTITKLSRQSFFRAGGQC
jgi:hypothetical protein